MVKPVIKWIGGKTQILDKLFIEFPKSINNYHEIFLGGGSVLLELLSKIKQKAIKVEGKIYANDLNEALVYVYKNIQTSPIELYDAIQIFITQFNECETTLGVVDRNAQTLEEAKSSYESYYYWARMKYNKLTSKTSIECSALFIFLNKTCFRGRFREGPNGFNVPYGNDKNHEIINKEHIMEIHELIKNVEFKCCDFQISLSSDNIVAGDFIYLDPPYAPITDKSFVKYTKDGFGIERHKKLFGICQSLQQKNIKFLMSNADVELIKKYFPVDKYDVKTLTAKRSINSKNPGSTATEVLIKS